MILIKIVDEPRRSFQWTRLVLYFIVDTSLVADSTLSMQYMVRLLTRHKSLFLHAQIQKSSLFRSKQIMEINQTCKQGKISCIFEKDSHLQDLMCCIVNEDVCGMQTGAHQSYSMYVSLNYLNTRVKHVDLENNWRSGFQRGERASKNRVDDSLQKPACVNQSYKTLLGAERAIKDLSFLRVFFGHMLQERNLLSVPSHSVPCQSPESWNQENLQITWIALNVRLPLLSSRLYFSFHERCLRTWSFSRNDSPGAGQFWSKHELFPHLFLPQGRLSLHGWLLTRYLMWVFS